MVARKGNLNGLCEVRFHGRGGQGTVVASKILAYAAFADGYHVQSFPEFGVERRGAPVKAFLRVSTEPILTRSAIELPDCVVVLDPFLLGVPDVRAGIKKYAAMIYNSRGLEISEDFGSMTVTPVNATEIAVKNGLGTVTTPLVNTAMAGAFAGATGILSLESVKKAIRKYSPSSVERNVAAAVEAFESAQASYQKNTRHAAGKA